MIVGFCKRKPAFLLQNLKKQCLPNIARSASSKALILGIETSCDDTGCAVLDTQGNVLGEALHSQQLLHLNNGGIIPPIAQEMHRAHIEHVVDDAVKAAGIGFSDLSAIAVTVKPEREKARNCMGGRGTPLATEVRLLSSNGLPLSLMIGTKYAKHLCRLHDKPLIPIHHMKAHALTARMHDKSIKFPFLVLLISGGHCLLAVAKDADRFYLLGDTLDDAPGEAYDKVARRMKLKNVPEYSTLSGGRAVELAASKADDPLQFKFTTPLVMRKDCCFSMAGIKSQVMKHLWVEEKEHGGVAIFIHRAKVMGGFDQGLNEAMDSYKNNATNDTTVMDFNFIQKTLHCCGKKGPDDWKGISVAIPEACCIKNDCNVANKEEVFKDGCYAKVIKFLDANIGIVAGVAIAVAFFPLIGVLLSCCATGGCSCTSCGWGVSIKKQSLYERVK